VEAHEHESFIKTPQQLVVVVLAAFLVPIVGVILLVQLVMSLAGPDPKALAAEAVAERLQPVAKLGDQAAWAPRIKTGMDALAQTVIKGKGAMPPKGGNPSLSDQEIRAAVDFMVAQSK